MDFTTTEPGDPKRRLIPKKEFLALVHATIADGDDLNTFEYDRGTYSLLHNAANWG